MTAESKQRILILGGGLTGISTAVHLRLPWTLLEKESRLGGHARTDHRAGFYFDKTGHWLHLRDPYTQRLLRGLLPGDLTPVARRSRVFSHGVLTRYPFQANLWGLPRSVIEQCLESFREAHRSRSQRSAPKNFEEYCRHYFGDGITREFMIPYNRKLWGVEPREITSDWCSRFVPLPDLEAVEAGAAGPKAPELGYNVNFVYPKQGGIETMTRALVARMSGGEVRLSTQPDSIDWKRRRVQVGDDWLDYAALVATLPLPELLRRMEDLPEDVGRAGSTLRWNPVRYLNVATKTRPDADFHWIYVPEEKYPFYRAGIYTNAVAGNAPPGRGALYVELAGQNDGGLEDSLRDCLPGLIESKAVRSAQDVLFAELRELPYAYVIFDHNYYGALATIMPFLENQGIFPRGRYGSWVYNSMEDCILAGREVAELITARHSALSG